MRKVNVFDESSSAVVSVFVVISSLYAEKANVFFIHGANMCERDARAWAAEMFKRLC